MASRPLLSALREARWFGRERAIGYAKVLALAFAPSLAIYFLRATGPSGSDFLAFWGASKLTLSGAPALAYSPAAQSAVQLALCKAHWFPFIAPPPFLLLVAPVAALPYPAALAAWVCGTYLCWLLVARRLAPGGGWPIAVFPGALVNAWFGQNGFVTAALFVGAILTLARRPFVAGLLLGALIIKPQLAVLVPVALVAGREWKAFAGAAVSSAGLLALSVVVLGPATLAGFLSSTGLSAALLTEGDGRRVVATPDFLQHMASVFAALRAMGASMPLALGAQAAAAAASAALVWWAWRRTADPLARGAVLACAAALTTPYLFNYDLVLLIVPLCWFAREGERVGFRAWERLALVGLYWSPMAGIVLAEPLGVNPTPAALLLMMAVVATRLAGSAVSPRAHATGANSRVSQM